MAIVGLSAVDAYSVLQKRDGAHGHDHGHAAAAPSSGYDEPAASYGAPAASYGAPAASYSEPASSYGEPAASYGEPAPAYGAEEAALPDLTPIIIGILALVGLSLLFPQFVNVDVKRRKRNAAEGKNMSKRFINGLMNWFSSVSSPSSLNICLLFCILNSQTLSRLVMNINAFAVDITMLSRLMLVLLSLLICFQHSLPP